MGLVKDGGEVVMGLVGCAVVCSALSRPVRDLPPEQVEIAICHLFL